MKLRFNRKTFFIFLVLIVVIDIISAYLLFNIDQIVHGDLYHYGLIFDIVWANNYWITMSATLITVWISIFLSGFLITILYFSDLKTKKVQALSSILLLIIAFTTILGLSLITNIDKIVSVDLGLKFGVQYDFRWTHNYYLISRLFFGLKISAVAIATFLSSWTLLLLLKPNQTASKLKSYVPIIIGALILLFSTLSSLALGVNLGLGLILIGIIVGYITSQEFIKKKILTSQLTSTYAYLEENIKKIGKFDNAIYYPSYLTKDNINTIILIKEINKTNSENKTTKSTKTKAYHIVPPGNELVQLFEKKLKTNFAKVDIAFLQKNLPTLITENLEIASNLQITQQEETIHVEIENSIYNDYIFYQKFSQILKTFGCPLSSAIGCAIAKATGKLTIITEYTTHEQQKSTNVTYNLLSETIKLNLDNLANFEVSKKS